jgi:pimeloyl-ACP methyl ester carboxylesterase
LNDVEDYLAALPEGVPRLLLGISWGGTLAAAVARRTSGVLSGLGLLCPGLFSRKDANLAQRIAVRLLHGAGLGKRYVPIPLRDPALFTNTERGQAYIARDPLNLWAITLSFAAANLDLVRYATERPQEIRVPALLMLSGKDPITANGESKEFHEQIAHPDRQLIEYPNASHTLEFEPDRSGYFQDLAGWCRRIAVGSAVSRCD